MWCSLSDVVLSQCLYRDLLFRKFCHLELGGDVPEASTLRRLRNQLVEHDLWERLLGEINRQLEAKNIILTEGRINIIDATPVEAAQSGSGKGKDGQPKRDKQAGWHVKKDSRGKLERFGIADHVQRKGYPLAGRALHAREAQPTTLGARQQAQRCNRRYPCWW